MREIKILKYGSLYKIICDKYILINRNLDGAESTLKYTSITCHLHSEHESYVREALSAQLWLMQWTASAFCVIEASWELSLIKGTLSFCCQNFIYNVCDAVIVSMWNQDRKVNLQQNTWLKKIHKSVMNHVTKKINAVNFVSVVHYKCRKSSICMNGSLFFKSSVHLLLKTASLTSGVKRRWSSPSEAGIF